MTNVPGAFEGKAHFKDLYYRGQRLGTIGQYSIAPSGMFALFEHDGRLWLFNQNSGKTADVTDGAFSVPKSFDWHEAEGFVEVAHFESHAPTRIVLR